MEKNIMLYLRKISLVMLLLGAVSFFPVRTYARPLFGVSIHEQAQYSSWGYGASLRGGYHITSKDSLSLVVRTTYTRYDFRNAAALAAHAGLAYRRILPWQPYGLTTFGGATVGAGFWTACVWAERCGGFGPSLGAEMGVKKTISPWLKLTGALQIDAHTSWFAGEETIPMLTLRFGVEY